MMDSIELKYPNLTVRYVDHKNGPVHKEFTEIAQGAYAYRLSVGDKIPAIRYRDTNYDTFYGITIIEIREDGLVITAENHYIEVKVWNREGTAYQFVKRQDKDPFFVPFKKWLPNAGWYKECNLYIEPCESFYERNKFADILSGKVRTEGVYDGSPFVDCRGEGIFYRFGGGRTKGVYGDNLKNFVSSEKEIQISLFDNGEDDG